MDWGDFVFPELLVIASILVKALFLQSQLFQCIGFLGDSQYFLIWWGAGLVLTFLCAIGYIAGLRIWSSSHLQHELFKWWQINFFSALFAALFWKQGLPWIVLWFCGHLSILVLFTCFALMLPLRFRAHAFVITQSMISCDSFVALIGFSLTFGDVGRHWCPMSFLHFDRQLCDWVGEGCWCSYLF